MRTKTCPNCGAVMAADVKFCTNCGSDLRNVKLDLIQEEKRASRQTSQPNFPASQPTRVENLSLWEWFVNSWRHPFEQMEVSKWFGLVTLLAENLLFVLGIYICVNKLKQNANYSDLQRDMAEMMADFSNSEIVELFLFLILVALITVAGAYFAHQFIYGRTKDFFSFVNEIVGMSNLGVILYFAAFVFLLIATEMTIKLALPLASIAMILFSLACGVVLVTDKAPAMRDKYYGLLIMVGIEIIAILLLGYLFGNDIYNQFEDIVFSIFYALG